MSYYYFENTDDYYRAGARKFGFVIGQPTLSYHRIKALLLIEVNDS